MPILSFDEFEQKKLLTTGLDDWLTEHEGDIREWAHKNLTLIDTETFINRCHKEKELGPIMRLVAKQMNTPNSKKLKTILEPFHGERGQIHLICGKRRGGKTCLMYMLAEKLSKEQEIWMLGPPMSTPSFISGTTTKLQRTPPNSTILIDDAGMNYYCRVHDMERNDAMKRLGTLAHTNKNLILNTQNTATIDVDFTRQASAIWFKSFSVFQAENERAKISKQLSMFMPNNVSQVLYFDSYKIYRLSYGLPDWWDEDKYSKTYSNFKSKTEMWRFIVDLLGELTDEQIIEQVSLKSAEVDIMQIATLRMLAREHDLNGASNKKLMQLVNTGFDETPVDFLLQGKQRNASYDFRMRAGQEEIWRDRFLKDPELELRTRRCVNSIFLKDLRDIMGRTQHILLQICDTTGATGTGKSWLGASIGETIGKMIKKPFTADDICFNPEGIAERVKAIDRLGTVECEEIAISRFGVGSGRSISEIENMTQTLRESQISFIYTSPAIGPYLYHYRLEMFGIDETAKISRALLYGPNETLPMGFITFSRPSEKLVKEYEKKKHAFMQKIKKRTTGGKEYLQKLAEKILDNPKWEVCKTQSMKKTLIGMTFPHLSTGEIEMVRDLANMEGL